MIGEQPLSANLKGSDPESWLDAHGNYLYQCALLRVRDPKLAEDIVQETLLSALESRDRFAGRSSERTWLVGILKHKVVDHFRRVGREYPLNEAELSTSEPDEAFDPDGHWKLDQNSPVDWADPGRPLERKEFWEVMGRCLSKLPPRTANAFSLREIDELSTDAICEMLNITMANLWVMLHRARMQLRRCLEANWFGAAER